MHADSMDEEYLFCKCHSVKYLNTRYEVIYGWAKTTEEDCFLPENCYGNPWNYHTKS